MLGAVSMSASSKVANLLFGGLICAYLALFLLASRELSVEADEAWMLLSTMHAFRIAAPATSALQWPIFTTGGIHFITHGLLAAVTKDINAHRAVTLAWVLALLFVVYRCFTWAGLHQPHYRLAGLATVCAVPNFALQAGLATGEVIATTVLLGWCLHHIKRGGTSFSSAAQSGLILGLSCATRISLAPVIAVPVIYAAARPSNDRRAMLVRGAMTAAVALDVMVLSVWGYIWAFSGGRFSNQAHYIQLATGLGTGRKSVAELMHSVVVANGILPVFVMVMPVAFWCATAWRREWDRATEIIGILVITGAIVFVAWVWTAPLPHLRYLWPGIIALWTAGAIQVLSTLNNNTNRRFTVATGAIALTGCLYSLAAGLLTVAQGDSVVLVYQAIGGAPSTLPGSLFAARRDQEGLAAFMAARPVARFFAPNVATTYPLTYLSNRPVEDLNSMSSAGERYLIMVPADYSVWRPSASLASWRAQWTDEVYSQGGFTAFRIKDRAPQPIFVLPQMREYGHTSD